MKKLIAVFCIAAIAAGCKLSIPEYPHENFDKLNQEANQMSDELQAYIYRWLDGEAPSQIPRNLLPDGIDENMIKSNSFRLVHPDEITAEEQFSYRKTEEIDLGALHNLFPDPHCTYLVLSGFWVPFGHKVRIEGDFPRCRFFSIQVAPLFYPGVYTHGYAGEGEVPILDVDIANTGYC